MSNQSRLLRLPAVCALTGLSRATVYRLSRLGAFPHPVRIGLRAVAWPSDVLDAWIAQRAVA